jgi:FkbM family methyltransferase
MWKFMLLQPYSAASRIIHNQTTCEPAGDLLRVTTPVEQWAYAVEFSPRDGAPVVDKDMKLKLRARVYEGAIGLGLLTPQRTEYQREVQVVANEESELVEISLPQGAALGALMLRNTSVRGRSRVDLDILGCEVSEASQATAISGRDHIVIDPAVFASFKLWSGWVPSGFFADWTGILTRADVWAFTPDYLAVFNRDRHEDQAVPINAERVLDWAPLAQAVNESLGTFRMAALGAGWGRWLAAGAALAAQTGRDYRLLGVEAEPQHFEWMLRHFKENKIPESHYIALNAAATGTPGDCWFVVGNSQAWYGQAIRSEGQNSAEAGELRRTRGVTIDEILGLLSPLDYLHMDIQGAELDVLSYRPDLLDRDVRLVNIGTHSIEIEAGLRKLFRELGWDCLYDIQLGSKHPVRLGDKVEPAVEFGDGIQVWRNPRLGAR